MLANLPSNQAAALKEYRTAKQLIDAAGAIEDYAMASAIIAEAHACMDAAERFSSKAGVAEIEKRQQANQLAVIGGWMSRRWLR